MPTTRCRPQAGAKNDVFARFALPFALCAALLMPFDRAAASPAIGTQYDTTHVYVAPGDFNKFVSSLLATFGGSATKQGVFTVTPTPSLTMSQLVLTPAGSFSVFGFKTPIPYPFGQERTGYLVKNLDRAVSAAQSAGASVLVSQFPDPVGLDAVVQWPGGINMQLYWHTKAPNYPKLQTIPENRIYIAPDRADEFKLDFIRFAGGRVISDVSNAPGIEIGQPGGTYRRIRIESPFGDLVLLATNGHLAYPYGHDVTGYDVSDLTATLAKASASGATILIPPYSADGRRAAMVAFPGGYIAEVHEILK